MGFAQQLEPNALVTNYQSARTAYSERQFRKSAIAFRSVAEQCPGSELAIQCEYFAIRSDWAVEPCDGCAAKLSTWLEKTKKFQAETLAAGRTFNATQLTKWTENAELTQAKWDRQQRRFKLAEQRLRTLVGNVVADPNFTKPNVSAWLELGSLLVEQRHDNAFARTCFDNVLQGCNETEPSHSQALMGCALTCLYSEQYAEAREFLNRLKWDRIDDELKIQVPLLRVKVAMALGEAIEVAKTLEPAVQLALASNPQAATLYELAMVLIESGEQSNANAILLHLVHQFPNSPLSIEARVRLARNASEKKQWKETAEWSDQALKMDCPKELQTYAWMLRGQANLEQGALSDAKADFEAALTNATGNLQLEISIRFQLAEALYQLQRWPDAEQHWIWLSQTAESGFKNDGKPAWFPVVLLRSAELLALRKEWGQAEQMVLRIRKDFPRCNRACEVDYLLARCLVSKADFDAAREILRLLSQKTGSTPDELVARAHWMMGETYLMQRRHSDAQLAYREVLKIPNQEYWHSASLLQIAQCCEVMQDLQGAKEAYETIINQFRSSPFAPTAKERLNLIPSFPTANQQAKVPLGTKR